MSEFGQLNRYCVSSLTRLPLPTLNCLFLSDDNLEEVIRQELQQHHYDEAAILTLTNLHHWIGGLYQLFSHLSYYPFILGFI